MVSKKSGFDSALEMLQGLTMTEQKRILSEMAKTDSKLADALQEQLVSIEDLKYATPKMLVELMREIDSNDLGLALKICSNELKAYFKENLSASLFTDLEELFNGPPVSLSKVEESMERVMTIIRTKVEKGELILNDSEMV